MPSKPNRGQASRREFFARVGTGAVALAAAAPFGPSPFGSGVGEAAVLSPTSGAQRANRAFHTRLEAALRQYDAHVAHPANRDDDQYPNYIGSFSKTLPHDAFGEVDPSAYRALRRAIASGDPDDFAAIPMGTPGGARLANPQAALAFDLVGADSHALSLRAAPAFASAEEAGEMTEVYWQAVTRDVPLIFYGTDTSIAQAAASLSTLRDFRGPKAGGSVTPATVFRGPTAGDLAGPYLSQFLWKDIPQGPYLQQQKVREALPAVDYAHDYASWLTLQNGGPAVPKLYNGTVRRYIATGRDLAEWLHRDYSYQGFLNAALMLQAGGAAALADGNPYKAPGNQGGFTTFGSAHILDAVVLVGNLALHAAWFQKWCVHRRLRPEEFGGRVHHKYSGGPNSPIHADLANSGVLPYVRAMTAGGTYLLPMAYPEGAPIHSAYPSGHASIAGACVTVLKAFFKTSNLIASPVEANADGSALLPYSGTLTVGGELDKLASNVGIGRNTAGIHWRTDAVEGMRLGETVAMQYLRDIRRCFNESFVGFSFTRFDGTPITI